jgi:hypothetical protein
MALAEKLPLAPEEGAVKVTVTPANRAFVESLTVTCIVAAKAVPTVALCGVPVAVIDAGTPTLVTGNVAGEATPDAVAVTL